MNVHTKPTGLIELYVKELSKQSKHVITLLLDVHTAKKITVFSFIVLLEGLLRKLFKLFKILLQVFFQLNMKKLIRHYAKLNSIKMLPKLPADNFMETKLP